jgi:uncharacterized protein YutE (UPF0331/DUF86 family)
MILFSLLNRVFDLGSEVAIAHNLGIPSKYREIFVLMRKNELIKKRSRTQDDWTGNLPEHRPCAHPEKR